MRDITKQMLADLDQAVSKGGSRGDISNKLWAVVWRNYDRRIEAKVRERVFTFHSVHIHERYRGKGHFTELLRHLAEKPEIGGRRIDWIYLEQCRYRLAVHLERELLYQSDFGMVIDCWRNVTGQLEMKL